MAAQTYLLDFDGYWRELAKKGVPAESGIYNVYTCIYERNKKEVSLKKHIYTGESENVRKRISNHEKQSDWEKCLKSGEVLCYAVAKVAAANRVRCEASIIHKHKPPINTEYVQYFPFDKTTMNLSGMTAFLEPSFTVYRKE